MAVNIYVWWAPGDEAHRDTLVETWLAPLVRDRLVRVYDERMIPAGMDARMWRQKASSGAQVFIVLVTARLIAETAVYQGIAEAINGQSALVLVPVLVSPADTIGTIFEGLVPLPNEPRPSGSAPPGRRTIVEYDPRDCGWELVGRGIRALVQRYAAANDRVGAFPITVGARDGTEIANDAAISDVGFTDGEEIMQTEQIQVRDEGIHSLALGVGSRLGARYKLLEQASRRAGTMVFPAWDAEERQTVLVHVLSAGVVGSPLVREGILERVDAWAQLRGTALVPVLEPRRRDGSRHYFVSGLDEGPALLDLLLREGLCSAAVVPLMVKLAMEIEELHRQGYVHGNVRPQEVFLHRDGRLQLGTPHPLVGIDLTGLLGEVMGPRSGYWAPELTQPPRALLLADPRTDVYGLALTAAVAISGAYPPSQSLADPVAFVDTLSCDREVKRVLRRALAVSPGDRYPTMEVFRVELVRAFGSARSSALVEMVEVPGGNIRMVWELHGQPSSSNKRAQRAKVGAFALGKYAITQAQYETIMGVNPSETLGRDHPVTRVSFRDALEFCNRLSVLDGLEPVYSYHCGRVRCRWEADGYRLPTEAEWELAARGEAGRRFAWGDDPVAAQACWNGDGNEEGLRGRTGTCAVNKHPRGATPPQSAAPDSCIWGMTGNVWEWCWDYFGAYPGVEGGTEPELEDPIGPAHPEVPIVPDPVPGALNRILRGGSWKDVEERWMRASARNTDDERVRRDGIGFRVARGARLPRA